MYGYDWFAVEFSQIKVKRCTYDLIFLFCYYHIGPNQAAAAKIAKQWRVRAEKRTRKSRKQFIQAGLCAQQHTMQAER